MSASQKRDGANGSITIFLCLTLTCIMALIGGLYESARAAGCGFYMQMALDSALDSAAACYFRPLWDRYRIFGFWCDGEAGLEETLEPYLRDYMAETPYYRLADSRVEATQILSLTDREGEFYEQEAVEYMKLGVFEGMPEAVDAAEAGNLLHQAGSLGKVLGSYRTNGRDVLRLEKAAENIRENMEKQAEAMRKEAERQANSLGIPDGQGEGQSQSGESNPSEQRGESNPGEPNSGEQNSGEPNSGEGKSGEGKGKTESQGGGGLSAEIARLIREQSSKADPAVLSRVLESQGWFRIKGAAKDGLGEGNLKDVPAEYRDLVRAYFLKLSEEK